MIVSAALAETFQLKNDKVQFEVDDKGNLVSLKNLVKNREYAGGKGLWRIIYQDGLSLEESLMSEGRSGKSGKTKRRHRNVLRRRLPRKDNLHS